MRPSREACERLYAAYLETLQRDHGCRVIHKGDSRFCRAIDKTLKILTLGKQSRFLSSFTTTLGRRIYVPDDWEAYPASERYLILRHEAVHVRQFRRFTWPGMTLAYVFLPLPMGLAGGRALLEWEAYRETVVATWQLWGPAAAHDKELTNHIVARFVGPDYAWMWLAGGMVRRAVAKTLRTLDACPPPPLAWPD